MKTRLFIGAAPLMIYPFVALADLMSLAATVDSNGPLLLKFAALGFQLMSLAYPLVFFASLIIALPLRKRNETAALRAASIPLWYLSLTLTLLVAWFALDSVRDSRRTLSRHEIPAAEVVVRS